MAKTASKNTKIVKQEKNELISLPTVDNRKIVPGKTYVIKELVRNDTDPKLQEIGRAKAASVVNPDIRYIRYNESQGKYDLGLDANSMDFVSKNKEEIKKILNERKYVLECAELEFGKNFHDNCLESNKTFSEFILSYEHNRYLTTDNRREAIELHCMMLDNKICFKGEEDEPKYKNATHFLICKEDVENQDDINRKVKYSLKQWFDQLIASKNQQTIVNILKYLDEPSVHAGMKEYILSDVWDKKIDNIASRNIMVKLYQNIDGLLDHIGDMHIVRALVTKGIISSDGEGGLTYNGIGLGRDKEDVLTMLSSNQKLFTELKGML